MVRFNCVKFAVSLCLFAQCIYLFLIPPWLWMMHAGAMLLNYCSSSILSRVSVSDSLTTTSSYLSTRQDGCVIRFGIVPTLRGLKHYAHNCGRDHSGNESLLLLGGFINWLMHEGRVHTMVLCCAVIPHSHDTVTQAVTERALKAVGDN